MAFKIASLLASSMSSLLVADNLSLILTSVSGKQVVIDVGMKVSMLNDNYLGLVKR